MDFDEYRQRGTVLYYVFVFFFPFLQLGIVVRNIRQRGARHQSEVTLMLRRALPRH